MKNRALIISIVVLVAVIAIGTAAYQALKPAAQETASQSQQAQSSSELEPLPDFALYDAQGKVVPFSDARAGKPSVINFWTTWCPYCVEEMDDFEALYKKYGSSISFVMIDCVDGQRETQQMGIDYVAEHGYTFPVYYDLDKYTLEGLGVYSYPTTLVLNKQGVIEHVVQGRMNPESLEKVLAELAG